MREMAQQLGDLCEEEVMCHNHDHHNCFICVIRAWIVIVDSLHVQGIKLSKSELIQVANHRPTDPVEIQVNSTYHLNLHLHLLLYETKETSLSAVDREQRGAVNRRPGGEDDRSGRQQPPCGAGGGG